MAMKDICEYRRAYNIIRRYVIFTFKRFYGEYIVNGKENIPEDGPVIYAANHLNALMDPLAVISLAARSPDSMAASMPRKVLVVCSPAK